MFDPRQRLFRQKAIEKLSSPERLDQLVRVVDAKGWLSLMALGILFAAALAWFFGGRIPSSTTGRGVIVKTAGIADFKAPAAGRLLAWNVKDGALLRPGDIIGVLRRGDEALDLRCERAGRVLSLNVPQGQMVEAGDLLGTIETEDTSVRPAALIYFPLQEGRGIRPGMKIAVSPQAAWSKTEGTFQVVVTYVSEGATGQKVAALLPNADAADGLLAGGPKLEVLADLGGAGSSLPSGTLISARVITDESAPVKLLFPF